MLGELTKLKSRKGISMLRIQESAKDLQRLRVTLDEAAHRNLSAEDHHVAAFFALQCTVERAIGRPDWAYILRHTLNFKGEANNLEDRRITLRSELASFGNSYDKLEGEAYAELAGVLIASSRSWCRDEETLANHPVSIDVQLTLQAADLRLLLTFLSVDSRENILSDIREEIARRLPRGVTRMVEVGNIPPSSDGLDIAVDRLILFALTQLWNSGVINAAHTLVFEDLARLFRTRSGRSNLRNRGQVPNFKYREPVVIVTEDGQAFTMTQYFYQLKQAGIQHVAEFLLTLEEQDRWSTELTGGVPGLKKKTNKDRGQN
ncbi:hypothetical protein G3I59_31185 [Amycolatopsis rubida]|uniref:Uncharacterized protein n=1 Tax=Amycolatopsis rubida TaxID=112413 RepID=A0ABX0BWN2_9PSEU|nr:MULTISPECIES: hypothetical protein [Amycolatopsis]MYW94944.1 hypothetical protein [Amycolatopsis rubida]NEC59931.1 hypothetical protein [Amycolatopsis rubida]